MLQQGCQCLQADIFPSEGNLMGRSVLNAIEAPAANSPSCRRELVCHLVLNTSKWAVRLQHAVSKTPPLCLPPSSWQYHQSHVTIHSHRLGDPHPIYPDRATGSVIPLLSHSNQAPQAFYYKGKRATYRNIKVRISLYFEDKAGAAACRNNTEVLVSRKQVGGSHLDSHFQEKRDVFKP